MSFPLVYNWFRNGCTCLFDRQSDKADYIRELSLTKLHIVTACCNMDFNLSLSPVFSVASRSKA